MNQRVLTLSPAVRHSVLLEMRRAVPFLDFFYLSGFAGSLALVDRENAGEPGRHDLQAETVACVTRAWGDFEQDAWAGGFVLELLDGRRVYLESYANGAEWGPGSCVSIVPVEIGRKTPRLPSPHGSELYDGVEDLPELGEYLRRLTSG